MIQAKVPLTGIREEDKWCYDNTTEASVLGRQFANAIVTVANGNGDSLTKKKKEYPPCKKIFWEEARFNAALENTNGNYAYDAHVIEETKHWKKAGKKFVGGPRFAPPRNFNGPLAPEEFEHLFEKPTVVFERSVQLHPFDRAKRYTKPHDRCVTNPEKAYLEMRTSLIGPSTYQLPDLWDSTVSHGIDTSSALQSAFKSTTPRFKNRKGHRSEFPEEKAGTSIPHSRGRSRGGGFKELPRQATEGEIAAKLATNSISTWESFQGAPAPEFDPTMGTNIVNANPEILNQGDPDKYFELSVLSRPTTGAPPKSRGKNSRSNASSRPSVSQSTGALLSVPSSRGISPQRTGNMSGGWGGGLSAGVSDALPGSRSMDSGGVNGTGSGTGSQQQRRLTKSRMPGFTILSKGATPIFDVPDYNKAYQRLTLPDGTVAILPVVLNGTQQSTPLNLSKTTSFNMDSFASASKYDSSAAEESLQAAMHLLGNNGPQIRSITPPHPSPPSLTRGNLYSALQESSPPRQSTSPHGSQTRSLTRDGDVLDDESSINSITTGTAKTSKGGSSYGKNLMQSWVPPVYYSSKNKVPIPEVGAIPYPSKRQGAYTLRKGGAGGAGSGVAPDENFAESLMQEFMPQHRPGSKGGVTLNAIPNRPVSTDDQRKSSSKVLAGGMNAGDRRRQDSIGAVPLPVGELALRQVVTKESAQVLKSFGDP